MFLFIRARQPTWLCAGLSIALVAAGCSGNADRSISRDTAAGTTTGAASVDTATQPAGGATDSTAADTSRRVGARNASVTPIPAKKPRVKPSIDPGRKSTDSASAGTAARNTTGTETAAPASPAGENAAAPASSGGGASQDQNLKYDAASNTVTFQLIGGPAGFQFNGYSSGGATLTLPAKANVVMNFINKDGTPHSAEVISSEGPLPNAAVDAAIPRAYTNQLLQGLPQEGTDVMRFQVPQSGSYRIICGVPGHALSGMWIWMKIDPAAKTPSFGATKK
jgi:sulfocyanin